MRDVELGLGDEGSGSSEQNVPHGPHDVLEQLKKSRQPSAFSGFSGIETEHTVQNTALEDHTDMTSRPRGTATRLQVLIR